MLFRSVFEQVEVATFRSDHDYLDGRHPEQVRFESDPRELSTISAITTAFRAAGSNA